MSDSHLRAIELLTEKAALTTWHRRWVYAALGFVWFTGALWVFAHYAPGASAEFAERSPLEAWALRLHGAAAFAFLVALGSMFAQHVPRAWHLKRNIASGICTLALAAFLVGTGYALYYFALDDAHAMVSVLHWSVGLATIAIFPLHVRLGHHAMGRTRRLAQQVSRYQAGQHDRDHE